MKSRALLLIAASVPAAMASTPIASAAQDAASPRFSNVRLSTGIRMHYAEQGDSNSTSEPIILLHGLSDSWFSFSLVLPLLSAQHHVFALDQRGHGNSDRPVGGYHMRDLAADVVAFMDAKRIPRATIVGHSMGSFVAQQVALAAPKRVSRLVLVGTSTAPRTFAGIDQLVPAIESLTDPIPTSFLREFQVSTVYQGVSSEFIDRAVAESAKLPSRVWRQLASGLVALDPPVALGRSNIPTLVIWGENDTYCLKPEQEALVAMIRSASLKAYPNTGHAVHWERPGLFARDVLAFAARRSDAALGRTLPGAGSHKPVRGGERTPLAE